MQSCPGPRNCLKCSLNWSQTKINFKRVHHSKTSISSSCAKFKGRYIKLLFPKSLLEIQNLTKVSFPFTSSVYFKSVDLNVHYATCPKNVLMLNIKWWLKVVHVDCMVIKSCSCDCIRTFNLNLCYMMHNIFLCF